MLKVTTDLLNATDEGLVSVLALLDLSAAFDTIDHHILLDRLQTTFGISETALSWFSSYISNRKQTVLIGNERSVPTLMKYGVPQGSVLGPILFSMYTQPLGNLIRKFGFSFRMYADDTQLYSSVEEAHISSTLESLNARVKAISSWMSSNALKLNEDKTELMIVGTSSKLKSVGTSNFKLCDNEIPFSRKVKNLGVLIDNSLSVDDQISNIRRCCYLELRKIAHIRPYLSVQATNKLVCAFVTSNIDYCNSLLTGIPECKVAKLQQVQNNAARLVFKKKKSDHVTPLLKELHWLPVKQRIEYKVASLVFQCLNNSYFPTYLSSMFTPYTPIRNLRSEKKNMLTKSRTK